MKAVVDTNVLVSGLINPHGAPGRIIDKVRSGLLLLVVDYRILAEYCDVLFRERMRAWLTAEDARNIAAFLFADTEHVVSNIVISGLPDAADAPFIEVAITCGAPLVTGNARHFPASLCRGHPVLSPATYVKKHIAAPA